jgi:hypothetical protein
MTQGCQVSNASMEFNLHWSHPQVQVIYITPADIDNRGFPWFYDILASYPFFVTDHLMSYFFNSSNIKRANIGPAQIMDIHSNELVKANNPTDQFGCSVAREDKRYLRILDENMTSVNNPKMIEAGATDEDITCAAKEIAQWGPWITKQPYSYGSFSFYSQPQRRLDLIINRLKQYRADVIERGCEYFIAQKQAPTDREVKLVYFNLEFHSAFVLGGAGEVTSSYSPTEAELEIATTALKQLPEITQRGPARVDFMYLDKACKQPFILEITSLGALFYFADDAAEQKFMKLAQDYVFTNIKETAWLMWGVPVTDWVAVENAGGHQTRSSKRQCY